MTLTSLARETPPPGQAWRDVPPSFREEIVAWAGRHKGKLYAPIGHPQLADIAAVWPPRRFEAVRAAVPADARTALDIGAHWGFFSIGLGRLGLAVTAVESNPENARFLRRIAELSGVSVDVEERSAFEIERTDFDVVLALNIFHHFLRKPDTYANLIGLLSRLRCRTMIYQAHAVDGAKMKGAFARIPPEEMCDIICRKTGLHDWELIETFNKRKMFRIY
jgi:hypothetical protein